MLRLDLWRTTRNPAIAALVDRSEAEARDWLCGMFASLAASPDCDPASMFEAVSPLMKGIVVGRAILPGYDPAPAVAHLQALIEAGLNGVLPRVTTTTSRRPPMSRAAFLAVPALLALGLSVASARDEVPVAAKPLLAPAVSVIEATRRETVETVTVTGTLVPRDEILVTPEIDGYRVTEVLVEEGARVAKGQVLARLAHDLIDRQIAQQDAVVAKAEAAVPQSQSNIEQAEAAETEARLSLERAKTLNHHGQHNGGSDGDPDFRPPAGRGPARVRPQRAGHGQGRPRPGPLRARRAFPAARPH